MLHRSAFFSARCGNLGWLVLPQFILVLFAPVVSLLGYLLIPLGVSLRWITVDTLLKYLGIAILLDNAFAMAAVVLEEITYRRYVSARDLFVLFTYAFAQHFGYQQMVAWWRAEGIYQYLRGRRDWGEQKRAGFLQRISVVHVHSSDSSKSAVAR